MPDLVTHVNQAIHNRKCADILLSEHSANYRDWAITAAFYAAVHYAEGSFTTDSAIKNYDQDKERRHQFRIETIRKRVGNGSQCWRSYRKLYEASRTVRYLTASMKQAVDYYSTDEADKLVQIHLENVREGLEKAFKVNLE